MRYNSINFSLRRFTTSLNYTMMGLGQAVVRVGEGV